ncbi:Flp1 family type IVb pilin [Chengkuizengella axinellae]|uniref:Flp1 family type IVb pilin n=1 Tax=Chengkuizengella axinellae TaxID=3064388 RepID=A0ABT9IXQ8_9BACL|nr:Flp1 family type IVb pilin [Chengkuizengella sp. 2205SS18-9]MDP5274098.1 Flp1 family type IVb pilin [Chengkuizengella sp. 2205SS18-9]
MKNRLVIQIKKLWNDEEGLGTLEILLIIGVLVAIAIVFRKWIISWVNTLFDETQKEMELNMDSIKEPTTSK